MTVRFLKNLRSFFNTWKLYEAVTKGKKYGLLHFILYTFPYLYNKMNNTNK